MALLKTYIDDDDGVDGMIVLPSILFILPHRGAHGLFRMSENHLSAALS
ncbi:hypothetical protein [Methanocalculus sp. MSAO_Arc2]